MSRAGRVRLWPRLWLAGLLLGLVAACVWAGSRAGYYLCAPAQSPEAADAIVSLGGDAGSRVRTAQRLFARGLAPRIVLTGIDHGDPMTQPAFVSWQVLYLAQQGVPREALVLDTRSGNSWEEARNTLALMRSRGWRRVLVVSDPPHMRRLQWVWSAVFAGSGQEYRLVTSDMPGWQPQHWWRHEKSAQFVLSELVKLAYYRMHY